MVGRLIRRSTLAGIAVLAVQAVYAVLRPAPVLESFDPSGDFGEPTQPHLRVAVLGDSSVTAPGVSGPQEVWVSLICERLARNRHVTLRSFAVGGSTARTVLGDQVGPAIAWEPDLILVSVGANDVIKGVPSARFARNLDAIIFRLTETGAVVVQSGVGVLGTIPRLLPPLSNLMSRRAARFDRIHWQVAARHGSFVVDQRSDDPRVWSRDRSLWAADHFHVSAAGHARWADTAWRTIGPLLDARDEPG